MGHTLARYLSCAIVFNKIAGLRGDTIHEKSKEKSFSHNLKASVTSFGVRRKTVCAFWLFWEICATFPRQIQVHIDTFAIQQKIKHSIERGWQNQFSGSVMRFFHCIPELWSNWNEIVSNCKDFKFIENSAMSERLCKYFISRADNLQETLFVRYHSVNFLIHLFCSSFCVRTERCIQWPRPMMWSTSREQIIVWSCHETSAQIRVQLLVVTSLCSDFENTSELYVRCFVWTVGYCCPAESKVESQCWKSIQRIA